MPDSNQSYAGLPTEHIAAYAECRQRQRQIVTDLKAIELVLSGHDGQKGLVEIVQANAQIIRILGALVALTYPILLGMMIHQWVK